MYLGGRSLATGGVLSICAVPLDGSASERQCQRTAVPANGSASERQCQRITERTCPGAASGAASECCVLRMTSSLPESSEISKLSPNGSRKASPFSNRPNRLASGAATSWATFRQQAILAGFSYQPICTVLSSSFFRNRRTNHATPKD